MTELDALAAPKGQMVNLSALMQAHAPIWINAPKTGGHNVVFYVSRRGDHWKFAPIYSDATLVSNVGVEGLNIAHRVSILTPMRLENTTVFFDRFDNGQNSIDTFFLEYGGSQCAERNFVPLSDDIPVPCSHSDLGDDCDPVFVMQDLAGDVIAFYTGSWIQTTTAIG